jgi:ABC-type dipeptide/oligopeptide/nickel transport system ATPase component
MCQRVMIAMCLTCRPRLLLADEPTTSLDVCAQAGILDLLRSLVDDHSGPGQPPSVLLVSHDLRVLADVADRVVVLREGKLVEEGPVATVLEAPHHAYTKRLVSVMPRLGAAKGPIPIPDEPPDASPVLPGSVAVGGGGEEGSGP